MACGSGSCHSRRASSRKRLPCCSQLTIRLDRMMMPVTIQRARSQPEEPTPRAMSAETMKMPEPIMLSATSMVASNRPSRRPKPVVGQAQPRPGRSGPWWCSSRLAPLDAGRRSLGLDAGGGDVSALRGGDELAPQFLAEDAVVPAVGEVDDQAQGQPAEQAQPVGGGQGEHEQQAGADAEEGDDRDEGA